MRALSPASTFQMKNKHELEAKMHTRMHAQVHFPKTHYVPGKCQRLHQHTQDAHCSHPCSSSAPSKKLRLQAQKHLPPLSLTPTHSTAPPPTISAQALALFSPAAAIVGEPLQPIHSTGLQPHLWTHLTQNFSGTGNATQANLLQTRDLQTLHYLKNLLERDIKR